MILADKQRYSKNDELFATDFWINYIDVESMLYFKTKEFSKILGTTMIISIIFGVIVIIMYLLSKTLRTPFFGKCIISHLVSYITYQVIYLYNIFHFDYSSFTYKESNLFIWQLSFQLMSQFWMNLLSYQTYVKFKKCFYSINFN